MMARLLGALLDGGAGDRRPGRRHAARRDRGGRLRARDLGRAAAAAPSRSRLAPRAPARPRPHPACALAATSRSTAGTSRAARAGLRFDSGGLAKGLFADLLAERLAARSFAVDCGGDLRFGGAAAHGSRSLTRSAARRCTRSSSPRPRSPRAASAGAAGSARDGRPAHHLLDPSTGARPRSRASSRPPRSRRRRWRPSGARRPRSSAGPTRRWLARPRRRHRPRRRQPRRRSQPPRLRLLSL